MCSRGSVIPLFVEQLQAGQPLTVTDPSMTRFLMSLDEAVRPRRARLRARPTRATCSSARPRPAPSRTSPWPSRSCSGVEPRIDVIGTRHGEKLYETLATREELVTRRGPGRLLPGRRSTRATSTTASTSTRATSPRATIDDYHSHNTERLDVDSVVTLLQELPALPGAARD